MKQLGILLIIFSIFFTSCTKDDTSKVLSSPKNTVSPPTMSNGKMFVDPEFSNFMDGVNKLPASSNRDAAVMSFLDKRKLAVVKTATNVTKENPTFKDSSFDYGEPIYPTSPELINLEEQYTESYLYAHTTGEEVTFTLRWNVVKNSFNIYTVVSSETITIVLSDWLPALIKEYNHNNSYLSVNIPCPIFWTENENELYPKHGYLPQNSNYAMSRVIGNLTTPGFTYSSVDNYAVFVLTR